MTVLEMIVHTFPNSYVLEIEFPGHKITDECYYESMQHGVPKDELSESAQQLLKALHAIEGFELKVNLRPHIVRIWRLDTSQLGQYELRNELYGVFTKLFDASTYNVRQQLHLAPPFVARSTA